MASDLTPWRHGRLDGKSGQPRILFGRTYEDPAIELAAFPPGKVMCIASAGCTPHALADRFDVVAVDINPVQLEYAKQRLEGAPAQLGTAELVMGALRTLLPLVGMKKRALEGFLALQDPAEQREHWRRLCGWRFRKGLDLLFSLLALRTIYSKDILSPLPERFGRVLLSRMERGFSIHENRENPYAHALLLGTPAPTLGPTARPIDCVASDAASYLEQCSEGTLSGVSLSNILDGAPPTYRARIAKAVRRATTPDAQVVWRSFSEPLTEEQARTAARDRSLLWGTVEVTRARDFV
jgi:S-adenosylmethionine:diacylglycerol 3-amino-3-carboxypropyl transferase